MSAVFIHAQWRTGSTYVFSKFRARSDSYFCYYEPIHETVMRAADEPNILLLAGAETCRSLRHPSLGAPYFQELYLTHEAWRQSVYKALVFEETFGDRNGGARRFYEALVGAAQGIPLIQDCRSIFRLKSLGTEVPGLHIHLWRSPRAQYVSYNISNYFHAATRLQITGDNPPAWARALAERFNFPTVRYESVDQEISAQQKFLIHVDAEYFVF
ncbi:MAG: hypothetical protein ACK5UX_07200, partial [Burkholderiales bacterium]